MGHEARNVLLLVIIVFQFMKTYRYVTESVLSFDPLKASTDRNLTNIARGTTDPGYRV